jgi:hypothetical protein
MGLYAPRTPGLDNYNAYVRPQLEQQAFNRQVDATVRGLESDRTLLDARQRATGQFPELYPVGPGVSGASFMNFQQYYPNYSGSR